MDTTTLLLGAGQLVLALAIGYIAWQVRHDSRRASLVSLMTVLNQLREGNSQSLREAFAAMSTPEFKEGDERYRAAMIDACERLRAVQAAINEGLVHTLQKCDAEWGFGDRLHAAFRAQIGPGAARKRTDLTMERPAL